MESQIKTRSLPKTPEEEALWVEVLKLLLEKVSKRVKDLEDAQKIPPEFWKAEITI